MFNSTGYGPSASQSRYSRLIFDGDERKYEQWEVKFLGYMRLQKLRDTILTADEVEIDEDKNAEAFAELIQFLDDKSLSLVMRDANDDGRQALKILRAHYASPSTPRVISLYTELTSLVKRTDETVTDYVIRAETTTAALKNAGETVTDSLLIAMVLKGLPNSFQSFVAVVTQSEKKQSFIEFKTALRSFEETEQSRSSTNEDSILKSVQGRAPHNHYPSEAAKGPICFNCQLPGHIAKDCKKPKKKLWCGICRKNNHSEKTCRRNKKSVDKVNEVGDLCGENEHSFAFKASTPDCKILGRRNTLLVDCGATTHIVNDETMFSKFDPSFKPEKHFIELANGEKSNNIALKRGHVTIIIRDSTGRYVEACLKNVLFVPTFPQNIFSVQTATEGGSSILFKPESAQLVYKDSTKFNIEKNGKLYYLPVYDQNNGEKNESVKYACDLKGWHEILGHCNYEDVMNVKRVVDGMKIVGKNQKPVDCDVCLQGKMTNDKSKKARVKSSVPLELIHSDIAGPITPASTEGFKYALSFTDDYSGACFVYFLKNKSDTVVATEKFLADSAPYGHVKCIRSDNGSEFTAETFQSLLRKNKIRHERSAPYSPHQNGTAERYWRTLFEMGRCLLLEAKLPKELWPYAIMTAAYIRNRCYSERLNQTPHFALTGKKPNISHMRTFGCECYAYTQNKQKLDPRCRKGIFVGYDRNSSAYLVFYPENSKVYRHRVVKFLSNLDSEEKGVVSVRESEQIQEDFDTDDIVNQNKRNSGSKDEKKTEITQGRSECMFENKEPSFEQRYPTRERRPPVHLADYETEFDDDQVMMNINYCYKLASFPQSYNDAMKSHDSVLWKEAMEEEIKSLNENETFILTTLPEGRTAVGGKWVYTVKEKADGSNLHKARFVAKGYSQVEGVDYTETFAPTANLTSVRAVMQLAAQHDLVLHQMDVKSAYLNAPIDCEIFMEQAEGFEVQSKNGEKLVYKLKKSLYGLKQSGRNWNNMLHNHLVENNFVQSPTDNCVYTKHEEGEIVVMIVWVDDLIVGAKDPKLLSRNKQILKDKFKMKDLGKLTYYLGIDFEQGDGYVKMNQKRYIKKVLSKFGMTDCKPRCTPSEQKFEYVNDEDFADSRKYREAVGSLIYIMMCTRPDICWIITKLSQYLSKPLQSHWIAMKQVLRYLKGTIDKELVYSKSDDRLVLVGYSDADWASSVDDRRSTSGYCFSLTKSGPLISWKSRKQPTVALSSCEAEYIALASAVQESLHLRQLMTDIDQKGDYENVLIFEDNQGTIALANNPVNRQRSKHIDIKYHFIRSELQRGRISLEYCPTAEMLADLMTKPATKIKILKFKEKIFGA